MAERPSILEKAPEILIADSEGNLEAREMKRLELDKVFDFIELIEKVLENGQEEAFKKLKEIMGFSHNQIKDMLSAAGGSTSTNLALAYAERSKEQQNLGIMAYMLGVKHARQDLYKFVAYLSKATVDEIKIQPLSFAGRFVKAILEHPDLSDLFLALSEIKPEMMDKIGNLFGSSSPDALSDSSNEQDSGTTTSETSPGVASDSN